MIGRLRESWRSSRSLGLRSESLLEWLIEKTQRGHFEPLETPQTVELQSDSTALASGRRELEDGAAIFSRFGGAFSPVDLAGLELLDLGCGYGGRTIHYARECGAARVEGVEVQAEMVRRCTLLADELGVGNVHFSLARAESLPFADATFDGVVSYDVLEHVQSPAAAFGEIARVLRPGSAAWLVFPTYLGARASHLDFVTRLPALHRVFDPDTIVAVVNRLLERRPDLYPTPPQPPAAVGAFGRRVLPTLNGMRLVDARTLAAAAGLRTEHERIIPILESESRLPLGRPVARALARLQRTMGLPDLLVGSIALIVVKSR